MQITVKYRWLELQQIPWTRPLNIKKGSFPLIHFHLYHSAIYHLITAEKIDVHTASELCLP